MKIYNTVFPSKRMGVDYENIVKSYDRGETFREQFIAERDEALAAVALLNRWRVPMLMATVMFELIIILGVVQVMMYGYDKFVVPLGPPSVPFLHFIGLYLFIRYVLRGGISRDEYEKVKERGLLDDRTPWLDTLKKRYSVMFTNIGVAASFLLIMWLLPVA